MKTKLLLNPGTGWAGTTPFYYTLRDSKFCNAGFKKEFHYLKMMSENNEKWDEFMMKRYTTLDRKSFRTKEVPTITAEYNKDYYIRLLTPPHTFEKYIAHMYRLKECFPDYNAVCDFSNYNCTLPQSFLVKHAEALKESFDVKVTFLIAEPVNRYYQEIGGLINQYHGGKAEKMRKLHKNDDLVIKYYISRKMQRKLFEYCIKRLRFSNNCNYDQNLRRLEDSYGKKNVLVIQMERFWDLSYHNEQTERLSSFLDYPISKLYPNKYCQDNKDVQDLGDQNTEFEPITPELYELGKRYL